jgi:AcrR family transcriptional regulator
VTGDVVPELSRSRWKGVPAESRTAERRELLLDVAFDLLGSVGINGTTVRGVCEAARLNPRYFYESFEDLDALLVAVFDRTANEGIGLMVQAVAARAVEFPDDAVGFTRVGIETLVRHLSEDPRRTRILFMEGLSNEALGRRRFETMHAMADTLVRESVSEEMAGDPAGVPSIVRVAAYLIVGGMAELLISWAHGSLEVTLEELVTDSAAIIAGMATAVEAIDLERKASGPARR